MVCRPTATVVHALALIPPVLVVWVETEAGASHRYSRLSEMAPQPSAMYCFYISISLSGLFCVSLG